MAMSPDHAMGLELELAELVNHAEEARRWNQSEELARLNAEIARLQEQLAETAEEVATSDPEPDEGFPGDAASGQLTFHGAFPAAA